MGNKLGATNRRDRRAALARAKTVTPNDFAAVLAEATLAFQQKRFVDAEVACKQILSRHADHATALNINRLLHQTAGNHRLAVNAFVRAVAANDLEATCHYNLATSYQALDAAATHFRKAIGLGLSGQDVESFLLRNPIIAECIRGMSDKRDDLFKEVTSTQRQRP
jgi:hypothetical protein